MTEDRGISWEMPRLAQDDRGRRVRELVPAAEGGDKAALRELRETLTLEEWTAVGDLEHQAIANEIRAATPGNPFLQEGIFRAAQAKRAELLGPNPTPVEKALVERVVLTWIACHDADLKAAAWSLRGGETRQGLFHLRRQESAQRRYLAALRALATARKLLGPGVLMLNVASGPQLNVVAPSAAPAPPGKRRRKAREVFPPALPGDLR